MPRTKVGEFLYDFGDFVEDYWLVFAIVALIALTVCGVKL